MVMVHGFLSSNVQWELNVEGLGQDLRLALVELPGHGQSAAPDDASAYSPAAIHGALERIRSDLGVDRWWVCAQSLGAAVALRYVLEHQPHVAGVIVTNTRAAFGTSRSDPSVDHRNIDLRSLPFHPIHAKRFPEDTKRKMVAMADNMVPHALNHTLAHRDTWRVIEEVADLRVPMLLVNGRFERAFQPFVDDARAAVPDLEVVHLDGGHSINVEQPEAFNDAVLDFVARRTPAT